PDGKPWQVQLGGQATDAYAPLVVGLPSDPEDGGSFATSGDFWHHFSVDGKRYSHTLDPRTGRPIEHGLSSVTVFHPECMHADALATVLTVLGPLQGLEFAEQHGIAAVLYEHGAAASTTAERHPAMSSAWGLPPQRLAWAAALILGYAALCWGIASATRRRNAALAHEGALSAGDGPSVLVVFASQTGQAESIARATARTLTQCGFRVSLQSISQLSAV
ncbi:MAG: FAD:protein FMN transferase, partial [Comamonas sp.]